MASWTEDEYAAYVIRNKQVKSKQPPEPSVPVPTENEEQAHLFREAALHVDQYPELALIFSIPNGSYKSGSAQRIFKATGLKRGVPDLMLPCHRPRANPAAATTDKHPLATYAGLFLEIKRTRGGVVSPEQAGWIANLEAQGYRACVCYGWEAAWDLIVRYLEGRE